LLFRSDGTEGPESAEKAFLEVPVEDVRVEWRLLWRDRIDDRVRAEGIANREYLLLFVERGTVIVATRDFKPLNFKEILCLHGVQDVERLVPPPPSLGGWGKFARTVLNKQKRARKWKVTESVPRRKRKSLQLKKGGRGWLHYRMER
jgi:hypothetical protein